MAAAVCREPAAAKHSCLRGEAPEDKRGREVAAPAVAAASGAAALPESRSSRNQNQSPGSEANSKLANAANNNQENVNDSEATALTQERLQNSGRF